MKALRMYALEMVGVLEKRKKQEGKTALWKNGIALTSIPIPGADAYEVQ
jgi:hypothetical protein